MKKRSASMAQMLLLIHHVMSRKAMVRLGVLGSGRTRMLASSAEDRAVAPAESGGGGGDEEAAVHTAGLWDVVRGWFEVWGLSALQCTRMRDMRRIMDANNTLSRKSWEI